MRHALAGSVALSALLALPAAQLAAGPMGLRLTAEHGLHLLLALTLAPLIEELALRPLLQQGVLQWLQRRGWRTPAALGGAAVVATLAFAAAHLDAFTLPALLRCTPWLAPGAALAAAWCWRQRTLDCVLLHLYFNAALWWASSGRP